jgi:hypothetical protein
MPQTRDQFYINQPIPRSNALVNGVGKTYYKGPDGNDARTTYYNIYTGVISGYDKLKQDGRTYGGNGCIRFC